MMSLANHASLLCVSQCQSTALYHSPVPSVQFIVATAAEPMLVNSAEDSGNSVSFVMFVYCTLLKSTTNNIPYLHSYERRLAVY